MTEYYNRSPVQQPIVAPEIMNQMVEVTVDFGNGTSQTSDINLEANLTAYSALEAFVNQNNIELAVKKYDFGVFVEKIGNIEGNEKMAWVYSVNGEKGQIAADKMILNKDDKVLWKFEEIEY